MKIILKNIKIIALTLLLGFMTLSSYNNNPNVDIIGTWVLEDDNNSKWVFTNNNCYWYYNNILEDTFTYSIFDLTSDSSPSTISTCGFQVRSGVVEDFYLKLIDQNYDEYCYEILGLSDVNLSINYLGTAKIMVFNKQ